MNEVIKKSWAGAVNNGDFIFVETYSGYRAPTGDPEGSRHFLAADASDEVLGVALLDALAHSRFVTPEERDKHPLFYDFRLMQEQYDYWVVDLMARYGYKTKRTLFKNMMNCSIESLDGVVIIRPWHHEKLEVWSAEGVSKEDYVILSIDNSAAEIGAALRLAFSRCT